MEKRISSRGIIIEDGMIYLMFRRKKKDDGTYREYYVIPGGGMEKGETLEENLKREMMEEFSLHIDILGFLGVDEGDKTIANYFRISRHKDEEPRLGGEELEKNSEDNHYEIRKIPLSELDKLPDKVVGKEFIDKAVKEEYIAKLPEY